jgi:hypothetical protein
MLSLPAALAVAFVGFAPFAFADTAAQRIALDTKLREFATQEGKLTVASTQAQIDAVNVVTASADDLVYAVFELAQNAGGDAATIADIAEAALRATPGTTPAAAKVRADKDKVVGRIMEAAVIANSTNGGDETDVVQKLMAQLGSVNSTFPTTKQLTLAGKQLLVAKALRSTIGLGEEIATAAEGFYPVTVVAPGATPAQVTANNLKIDAARTAFNVAVLKLLAFKPQTNDPAVLATAGTFFPILNGTPVTVVGEPAFVEGTPPALFGVQDYVDKALDGYTANTSHAQAALNIATGVAATVPAAAGAAIGGYVKELVASSGDVITYLKGTNTASSIVANPKLANAVSDIVVASFKLSGADAADAVSLATSTSTYSVPATIKGKIASGAIRANPADAITVVDQILKLNDGKPVTQTGIAAFAGAAAVGNSKEAAADIAETAIANIGFVAPASATPTPAAQAAATAADNKKIEAVAIAVAKSLGLVDPDGAAVVAERLLTVVRGTPPASGQPDNRTSPYTTEAARTNLAVSLVKGIGTIYSAAGSAVAGVVNTTLNDATALDNGQLQDLAARVSAAAIKAAPKAAVSIAQKVSNSDSVQGTYSGSGVGATDTATLAAKIAANPLVASSSAGSVAAGVSLTDTANAGLITAAVIQAGDTTTPANTTARNARMAAALTIANTVAINVDVEAIGLVARSVGELLQPSTSTSKLPKITTIGTLATSMAKAINLKPLVTWTNRVDELGELAAELTNQYLANAGVPDGTAGDAAATTAELKALANGLASIGTSIFKAASAKLLANTFHNAADVKDIAENVAGAIAQAIANSTKLAGTAKDSLLTTSTTGSLIALLKTAATASKSTDLVTKAFDHVAQTGGNGVYGDYVDPTGGNVTRENGSTGRYETGAFFEVGLVVGAETPIKNL